MKEEVTDDDDPRKLRMRGGWKSRDVTRLSLFDENLDLVSDVSSAKEMRNALCNVSSAINI